jgi:hypothetical protein
VRNGSLLQPGWVALRWLLGFDRRFLYRKVSCATISIFVETALATSLQINSFFWIFPQLSNSRGEALEFETRLNPLSDSIDPINFKNPKQTGRK